ncbi:unnamed protein product (macronuclear) [Paramecium tetraurelia]|uniref:Uncharacterized protein n=1 Tax=Paramecium tetraurelia TaxID=5888 RepID=A0CN33_PARTE|nr:uncharacterized protein GSPATT00008641001 [Paramecium tetraurelia]CAK72200.1 unnamed protein product [Paramecium tetraurelia]|eukprot:XP_001439597.1 hypothetical protein (macronuclear) [Paramecium tetraurelia strain d4-2]
MNKSKQNLNSLFDLSLIVEKIKFLEEQQSTIFNLKQNHNYDWLKRSHTQSIPKVVNDLEIRKKFKEIQRDSLQSWKPIIFPTNYNKSQIRSKQNNITPSPQEISINKKIHSTPIKVQNEVNKRVKSTDFRVQLKKTEAQDIEAQFLETRNIIKQFNRIKRKSVRFNILT